MSNFRIRREKGRVNIKDEFDTRLDLADDENLKDSILTVPGLNSYDRHYILQQLGLEERLR